MYNTINNIKFLIEFFAFIILIALISSMPDIINRKIKHNKYKSKRKKKLAGVDKMNGEEFEKYLEELFRNMNYKVKRTPYQKDFGADLIIEGNMHRYAVQAKRYTGNVGIKAVQEVVSAKAYYKCDGAIVVTNSRLTDAAKELAKSNNVIVIQRKELKNYIKKYMSNKEDKK